MTRPRLFAVALLAAGLWIGAAATPSGQRSPGRERSLYVSVVDQNGAPVPDLGPSDFLVKEARDLRNFKTSMTQEALVQQHKQEEVAAMLKQYAQLAKEHRFNEANKLAMQAQQIDPDVHLVTVYRTIDLLKRQGLIDELDLLHLRGDRHYYETHGPRDHIHVACLRCGKVREFESRLYEQLKDQISRDCDIKVTVSRTEVGGICNDCLASDSKKPAQ